MANLISLQDFRHRARTLPGRPRIRIFFDRQELFQLLDMYSRRVMSGEWRDYAIDHDGRGATFSVFVHTGDRPAFSITKVPTASGNGGVKARYVLSAGPQRLKQAQDLRDVIAALDKQLRLVWTQL